MSTVRIQLRRGLASEWAAADLIGDGVVLAPGEVGFITDENTFKVGNGDDKFGDLPYILESSLGDYIPMSQFGTPSGVATLDSSGILNVSQLPALAKVTVASAANQSARLALTAEPGDIAIQADNGQSYVLKATPASTDSNWQALVGSEAVVDTVEAALIAGTGLDKTYNDAAGTITIDIDSTVATKTYADTAEADAISTAAADATSKANAAQAAAEATAAADATSKANAAKSAAEATAATALSTHEADTTSVHGIPNTADLATKSYADNVAAVAAAAIVDVAPEALNTLNELAAALGDDPNFATSIATSLSGKLALAGGTMSGDLSMNNNKITSLPVPTSDYDAATKLYVDTAANNAVNEAETNASAYTDGEITSALSQVATDISVAVGQEATDRGSAISDALGQVATNLSTALTAHNDDTTSVHGISNTADLATKSYADTSVANHASDTTDVHGIADTSLLATKSYVDTSVGTETNNRNTAIGTHNSDTTDVHGIADTSLLATKSYADTAEADAITAAGTAADSKVAAAVAALTKSSVGLANVDNTSDADKPVSTATQTALDLKSNLEGPTFTGTVVLPSTTSIGNVSAAELGHLDGVTSSVQTQLTARLPLAGGTMTGALTLSGAPTSDLHAATKLYVDNVTAGINFHESVHAASVTNLAVIYNNGTNGVGATLTADTNRAFAVLDGETVVLGERVLIKNQTDAKQNGIYTLTTVGSVSAPWVLTRATDADNNPTGEMKTGDFTFVQRGTVNASVGYINNSTANPIVIGTDNISYTEFNAGKTVVAGSGLTEATPGTISVATGAITSDMIADGTIVNADISASAAIAQSKISGLTSDLAAKSPINAPTFTGLVTVAASGVAFTDGTQTRAGVPSITTFATAISSSATIAAGEQDKFVPLTGAVTITLPATGYSTGQSIDFYQASGTGAQFASTNSVVGTPGLKLRTTNSVATAMKTSAGWLVFGDLAL